MQRVGKIEDYRHLCDGRGYQCEMVVNQVRYLVGGLAFSEGIQAMHTIAYQAGLRDGVQHIHKLSPQHSYSWAHRQLEQVTTGRESKAYAYWFGYSEALRIRMPVFGEVASHAVGAASTGHDRGRLTPSQMSRLADPGLEGAVKSHNKALANPERAKKVSITSIDVVPVKGTRQFVSVINYRLGNETDKTVARHRQEGIAYANQLANIADASYGGKPYGRNVSRIGGNEVEKGRR